MGRKPTTGKFTTREELIEQVTFLHRSRGASASQIAGLCGVSHPTVSKILANASPTKRVEKATSEITGLWCWCYQKVDTIEESPFQAKIIEDLGSRWKLKIGKQEVMVNRGACSSKPFKKKEVK